MKGKDLGITLAVVGIAFVVMGISLMELRARVYELEKFAATIMVLTEEAPDDH